MSALRSLLFLGPLLAGAAHAAPPADEPTAGHPVTLTVELRENRFFLKPRSREGKTLTFCSDTGGGRTMVSPAVAALYKLVAATEHTPEGDLVTTSEWPHWTSGADIPRPAGRVLVRDLSELIAGLDGFLGQNWFGGRTWTFDYPGQKLLWRAPGDLPSGPRTPVHFNPGSDTPAFGRIQIIADAEPLDVLLDTGATTQLTPSAVRAVGQGSDARRATSFMKAAVFDRWRSKHPEWKFVPGAEERTGADMIEVPQITVAGLTAGPVWFTRRPDRAFDQFMSSLMHALVVGALGGSGLRYFRVTVDFASGQAVFER